MPSGLCRASELRLDDLSQLLAQLNTALKKKKQHHKLNNIINLTTIVKKERRKIKDLVLLQLTPTGHKS